MSGGHERGPGRGFCRQTETIDRDGIDRGTRRTYKFLGGKNVPIIRSRRSLNLYEHFRSRSYRVYVVYRLNSRRTDRVYIL